MSPNGWPASRWPTPTNPEGQFPQRSPRPSVKTTLQPTIPHPPSDHLQLTGASANPNFCSHLGPPRLEEHWSDPPGLKTASGSKKCRKSPLENSDHGTTEPSPDRPPATEIPDYTRMGPRAHNTKRPLQIHSENRILLQPYAHHRLTSSCGRLSPRTTRYGKRAGTYSASSGHPTNKHTHLSEYSSRDETTQGNHTNPHKHWIFPWGHLLRQRSTDTNAPIIVIAELPGIHEVSTAGLRTNIRLADHAPPPKLPQTRDRTQRPTTRPGTSPNYTARMQRALHLTDVDPRRHHGNGHKASPSLASTESKTAIRTARLMLRAPARLRHDQPETNPNTPYDTTTPLAKSIIFSHQNTITLIFRLIRIYARQPLEREHRSFHPTLRRLLLKSISSRSQ